ncbi:MAG: hypothetical protein QXU32_12385 [Nitrososphaerales archaeon]
MKKGPKSDADSKGCMLVGLDIHKNYIQAAVMNEQGRLLKEDKFQNDIECVETTENCVSIIQHTCIYPLPCII